MELYPEGALILAPLSGFTDLAYRRAARRGGCRFAFTEMVDAASLSYSPQRAAGFLRRGAEEEFLGVQIVGADHELLKRACEELGHYDFTLLDFNLGCPVPKIVKKGAGAALGREIDRALAAFAVLKEYSPFPLSAKFRVIDENDPAPTVALAQGLAGLGAQALTVHGRSWEHFYSGPVAFDVIRAVREAVAVPVIANGGVKSPETCAEMREKTGCSRVMLAQGAMGNPWLFGEIAGTGGAPTLEEWRAMVLEHVRGMIDLYGECSAMKMARKIVHDYLRGRGFPSALRAEASALASFSELEALVRRSEWQKKC